MSTDPTLDNLLSYLMLVCIHYGRHPPKERAVSSLAPRFDRLLREVPAAEVLQAFIEALRRRADALRAEHRAAEAPALERLARSLSWDLSLYAK
jgi:hypothetical protein